MRGKGRKGQGKKGGGREGKRKSGERGKRRDVPLTMSARSASAAARLVTAHLELCKSRVQNPVIFAVLEP